MKPETIKELTEEEIAILSAGGELPKEEKSKEEAPPITEPQKVKKALEQEPPKKADKETGFVAFYNATLNPITLNASRPLESGATFFNLPNDGTPIQIPKDRADMLVKIPIVQRWIGDGSITVGKPPKEKLRATSEPKPVGELALAREKGSETNGSNGRSATLEQIKVEHVAVNG